MNRLTFLAAVLSVAVAGFAHAEERRVTVNGTGSVQVAPDMATITLGVTNQDAEASAAMQATSDAVANVLTRLDQAGIEARDIQARDFSLSPVWENLRKSSDEAPKITGFIASNKVFVRVRNLMQLGTIMDAVIQAGANDFGGLSFGIQDAKPLQAKARSEAVADAIAKAEQLAQASNVTLGKIILITDHGGGPRPQMRMAEMSMAGSGGMPIASGEISVEANVTMVFEIAE